MTLSAAVQASAGLLQHPLAKPARRETLSRGVVRKQRLSQATPPWADARQIFSVYCEAAELRDQGHDVEVDHIIPLKAADVCGLHVHTNLQIVYSADNRRKENTHLQLPPGPSLPPSPQLALF
tara:strand:- start:3472 stop:3840 length:369 start_codon:yes stop_codon:yes gene_type:complete